MNTLPQDIYNAIGNFLQDPEFDQSALATVSRRWQSAIERHTFKDIRLRSNDLARFEAVVQNDRRRYVRTIEYIIILPGYADEDRRQFEHHNDRRANDQEFTDAIHRLFQLLRFWDVSECGHIRLIIEDVYSQSDFPCVRWSSPERDAGMFDWVRFNDDDTVADLLNWRHRYSSLRLLLPSELPVVPVIDQYRASITTRKICGRVPIEIATRLPNLREAYWFMSDQLIHRYITLRRTRRSNLAQAFAKLLPQSLQLRSLSLIMPSTHLWGLNPPNETLHPETPHRDTLSDVVRTATAHMPALRKLVIYGLVDWSLLWPGLTPAIVEPYWQNMEYLEVRFDPMRPSGGYYFVDAEHPAQLGDVSLEAEAPPGYRNNEEEEAAAVASLSEYFYGPPNGPLRRKVYEVVPDDASLVPLIKAFGQACLQMPKLKAAEISSLVPTSTELDTGERVTRNSQWGIYYFSPHTPYIHQNHFPHPAEDRYQRRLFWDVRDWRPDTGLQGLLKGIGRERHGEQLVERFIDSWNTFRKGSYVQDLKRRRSGHASENQFP
ncbi:hypothetical protein O1611_g2391 [Lasiodiplodia mahajangana]|uniref:Uncharacterized protein n=1 Tax=Lasiodiplodia mahajangana TaxID=1108764 RepID=A0ACC2JV15_9PEZI|nr:hypothetical protein O1611_g2391 [Lasiodiplodia mahajangana]